MYVRAKIALSSNVTHRHTLAALATFFISAAANGRLAAAQSERRPQIGNNREFEKQKTICDDKQQTLSTQKFLISTSKFDQNFS